MLIERLPKERDPLLKEAREWTAWAVLIFAGGVSVGSILTFIAWRISQ
jgi:hypothetical protein